MAKKLSDKTYRNCLDAKGNCLNLKAKQPKTVSVFCCEATGEEFSCVVLNTDRGLLRAAVITDENDFVKWIGNKCIGAVVPRRNAQNKAVEMGMLSC